MNENENDGSNKKKLKQGTLDGFVFTQQKTNFQNASSSSIIDSSIHSDSDLDNETEEIKIPTMIGSLESIDLQFLGNGSNFDELYKIVIHYATKKEYRPPLLHPLLVLRYLLHQGLPIHGRLDEQESDEEESSSTSKGHFIGLLELLATYDETIDEDVIKNAPLIQTDMIHACSLETTKAIVQDIGDEHFAILVDNYPHIEYDNNPLCLRYVDKEGDVVERFLGTMNVVDSKALSLSNAICSLLEKHSLSSSKIRGQGYNGVSNMNDHFNGLQALIKKESQSAYYTHCLADHLQLTLVAVSKEEIRLVGDFFYVLDELLKVVLISLKENVMPLPRERRFQEVAQAFEDFLTEMGKCLNLTDGSGRLTDDTCWGPFYKLMLNVIDYYPVILEMIDLIIDEYESSYSFRSRIGFTHLLSSGNWFRLDSFDFVFVAHLMKTVLEVTNELSSVLHNKAENLGFAMSLVKPAKERLQIIRDDGWETLLNSFVLFCNRYEIEVPNMEDVYNSPVRRRSDQVSTTNLHRFQVEVFFTTIDLHLHELNSRFDEVNTELLVCMSSLSPVDSFRSFDKQKLLRLAEFYPAEFSSTDLNQLNDQLDNYICDVRKDERFMGLRDIKELCKKLVKVKKHEVYNLVFLLNKLVLILPVITASVERNLSAFTFVKRERREERNDELLNDRLVTYIEGGVFYKISNDDILKSFQNMKTRQEKMKYMLDQS